MIPDLNVRDLTLANTGLPRGNEHAGVAEPAPFLIRSGRVGVDGRAAHADDHAAVLTSWKDIARYMGKGVRTVQRWEQDFGLPVRRPTGTNKKAILARPRDLDAWVAMRCSSRARLEIPLNGASHGTGSVTSKLCALNVDVETSRLLREHNRQLVCEITAALKELHDSLNSIGIKQR